jgi:RNA polymerase sigma-70 factor (ECF subfamily)
MLVAEPFLARRSGFDGAGPLEHPDPRKTHERRHLLSSCYAKREQAPAHVPIPGSRRHADPTDASALRERLDKEREQLVALLDATAAGDERAFAALHRRTAARMRAAAQRVLGQRDLAEEAVQDAYMQIWHHAAEYSPALSAPMTWMMVIARNRALDLLRQRTRERAWRVESDNEFDYDALASETPDPERSASAARDLGALRHALEGLSAVERHALELTFVDGFSNAEVAAAMNAPLGTVKSWIRRGLARLRPPHAPATDAQMRPVSGVLARPSL